MKSSIGSALLALVALLFTLAIGAPAQQSKNTEMGCRGHMASRRPQCRRLPGAQVVAEAVVLQAVVLQAVVPRQVVLEAQRLQPRLRQLRVMPQNPLKIATSCAACPVAARNSA